MTTVYIPTPMRKFTNNKSQVVVAGGSVAAIFSALDEACPGIKGQLYGEDGTLKRYINVFVSGKDIRNLDGMNTLADDRDEIYIVPAMAGG